MSVEEHHVNICNSSGFPAQDVHAIAPTISSTYNNIGKDERGGGGGAAQLLPVFFDYF